MPSSSNDSHYNWYLLSPYFTIGLGRHVTDKCSTIIKPKYFIDFGKQLFVYSNPCLLSHAITSKNDFQLCAQFYLPPIIVLPISRYIWTEILIVCINNMYIAKSNHRYKNQVWEHPLAHHLTSMIKYMIKIAILLVTFPEPGSRPLHWEVTSLPWLISMQVWRIPLS